MVRTVVCKKDGCSGNEFYITTKDNKLNLKANTKCPVRTSKIFF